MSFNPVAKILIHECPNMSNLRFYYDYTQLGLKTLDILCAMFFSKSFSYAIRAIIYLAKKENEKEWIQLDEIAESLAIPRFFLAKVMNRLVKEEILSSVKGHGGGFCINDQTARLTLSRLLDCMGEMLPKQNCLLQLGACDAANPCAVHHRVAPLRAEWLALLNTISIQDLLKDSENENLKKILSTA